MLTLLAALTASPQAVPAPADLSAMVALYDEVCLKTFPIDEQIDALMAKKGAKPLAPDDVKVSLGSDPGRGWAVQIGDDIFNVLLELPPYHACSVRAPRSLAGKIDAATYRPVYHAAVEAYKTGHRGFVAQPAMDADRGGIRMHGETEMRPLPGGGGEVLIVIDQSISDPTKLAPGTTATPLRFVHQMKTGN